MVQVILERMFYILIYISLYYIYQKIVFIIVLYVKKVQVILERVFYILVYIK